MDLLNTSSLMFYLKLIAISILFCLNNSCKNDLKNSICRCGKINKNETIKFKGVEIAGTYSHSIGMMGATVVLDNNFCFHYLFWDDIMPSKGSIGKYSIKNDTLLFDVNCVYEGHIIHLSNKSFKRKNPTETEKLLKGFFIWKEGDKIFLNRSNTQKDCISASCLEKVKYDLWNKESNKNDLIELENK